MPADGGKLSCAWETGKNVEVSSATIPSVEDLGQNIFKHKLVRDGDRLVSKNTYVTGRLNVGAEISRSESGLRFKTINELGCSRERIYKPVEDKSKTPVSEEPSDNREWTFFFLLLTRVREKRND